MSSIGKPPFNLLLALVVSFICASLLPAKAQQVENFPAGDSPCSLAFDGANIWVTDFGNISGQGGVTKLRASDGVLLDAIPLGGLASEPFWIAYDGENIWVTIRNDNVSPRFEPVTIRYSANFLPAILRNISCLTAPTSGSQIRAPTIQSPSFVLAMARPYKRCRRGSGGTGFRRYKHLGNEQRSRYGNQVSGQRRRAPRHISRRHNSFGRPL
jgi:hypothetical protein